VGRLERQQAGRFSVTQEKQRLDLGTLGGKIDVPFPKEDQTEIDVSQKAATKKKVWKEGERRMNQLKIRSKKQKFQRKIQNRASSTSTPTAPQENNRSPQRGKKAKKREGTPESPYRPRGHSQRRRRRKKDFPHRILDPLNRGIHISEIRKGW